MSLGKKVVEATVGDEKCYIRTLNAGKQSVQVVELMQKVGAEPQLFLELGALMVCLCHCKDSSGTRTYEDGQLDHIKEEASIGYLKEFTEKALDISGLGEDSEEIRKNLQAVQ